MNNIKNNNNIFLNLEKTNEILDSLDIGIHILDRDGITILYNKVCEDIEGISSSWIVGKDMKTLVYEGLYSESVALEVIEKNKAIAKTQKVNGRYIFSTGTPIYDNGEISLVVVSVRDITNIENLKFQLNELKSINITIQNELNILNSLDTDNSGIISKNKEIENIKKLSKRISQVDSTVLIQGESGVGKGIFSRYVHVNSHRKDGPFIKVDCSSLPESLIESELFGYEEGAFTGAKKEGKVGLIQLANKGTLFLDEIGELPLNVQVKLLGLIQEKTYQKIGGTKNISVDIRIIAATNKDLYEMVQLGSFRLDLYYRLKVVPIKIPALKDRKEDIPLLIKYFIEKLNKKYNYEKTISAKAMKLMIDYHWPGNVRELENEIERLVVTTEDNIIEDMDVLSGDIGKLQAVQINEEKIFKDNIFDYESVLLKRYIINSSNIHDLSEKTGLEISTLRKKAKKLNVELDFKKERNPL